MIYIKTISLDFIHSLYPQLSLHVASCGSHQDNLADRLVSLPLLDDDRLEHRDQGVLDRPGTAVNSAQNVSNDVGIIGISTNNSNLTPCSLSWGRSTGGKLRKRSCTWYGILWNDFG